MAKQQKELTVFDLLAALLDAQNRCNNLLGEMYNQMRAKPKDEQKLAAEQWREQNSELALRCKESVEKLDKMHQAILSSMLDSLDEIDSFDSDFQIRDFLDKYGYAFGQLNTIVQIVRNLCQ